MLLRRRRRDDVDVASALANLSRLNAVQESGLFGAPPSNRLDALARGAAERLDTPMAFMSVIDDRHNYHAASHEPAGSPAHDRMIPAEASFCQFVVAFDDVLAVNDTQADPLVQDHPATLAGEVRAYLGVPIRQNGHVLGSFCVVDTRPRKWTADDVAALEVFAERAMSTTD